MRPSAHGNSLRFVCACEPRDERGLTQQLHSMLQWLPQIEGLSGDWSVVRRDTWKVLPCNKAEDVAAALELGRAPADPSRAEGSPVCDYQSFYLGSIYAYHAGLRVATWRNAGAAKAPNQLCLVVHPALEVITARQVLLGMIGFFKPTWAAASPEKRPPQPAKPGQPAVGWLTYLSSSFGTPADVPAPAQMTSMKSLGVLIQAIPERFEPGDELHLEALRSLEHALLERAT